LNQIRLQPLKMLFARVVLYYANLGLRDPLVLRGMTFGMVKRLVKA